ncbi:hypothetical protein KJ980_05190 [Patescibacteria group bacterium]|nr:hypothetical protein [Patescibacteria group bacterium]MBU4016017.1 hypothetical protein [Patescibacteria group bacterium]MBU4099015.1 hypothetical protein [Patescibacteria group bacterium]
MPKYLFFLILTGLIIFLPTITIGFTFDDIAQIVNNKYVHHKENLPMFLKSGIAAPGEKNGFFTFFYRPFPFMLYTLLYDYGKGNPLNFHVVQLFFFLLNTCLVFILFSKFFSSRLSFILSLIFLVHPISQTLATYIADYFDTFSFFFGMLALIIIISKKITIWPKAILSCILLFFSLLSKESGALFIPLICFYGKLFHYLKMKIYSFSLLFVVILYALLRNNAYHNHFLTYLSSYPLEQPFLNRILMIPTLLFYYYKEIFAPALSEPGVKEITQNPPPLLIILGTHLLLIIGTVAYTLFLKKHHPKFLKIFLFFLCCFFLGIILYVQILPLDMLIERRWLSLALVGALGMLGVAVTTFPIRSKRFIFIFRILIALYILALTSATIKLNLDLKEWWLHIAPQP